MRVIALSVTAVRGQTASRISCFVTTCPWTFKKQDEQVEGLRLQRDRAPAALHAEAGGVDPARRRRGTAAKRFSGPRLTDDRPFPRPPQHRGESITSSHRKTSGRGHDSSSPPPQLRVDRRRMVRKPRAGWVVIAVALVVPAPAQERRDHGPAHPAARGGRPAADRAGEGRRHGSLSVPARHRRDAQPRGRSARRSPPVAAGRGGGARNGGRRRIGRARARHADPRRRPAETACSSGRAWTLSPTWTRRPRGVVGQDLLRRANWWIDYRGASLVEDADGAVGDADLGERLRVYWHDDRPAIDALLPDQGRLRLVLDSAASSPVLFARRRAALQVGSAARRCSRPSTARPPWPWPPSARCARAAPRSRAWRPSSWASRRSAARRTGSCRPRLFQGHLLRQPGGHGRAEPPAVRAPGTALGRLPGAPRC